MRWASLLLCCLFLAFAGAGAPLLATDLKNPRQAYPDDGPPPGGAHIEREVAEFCAKQRYICRKICNLRSRFEDRFDGCPSSCDTREVRCNGAACFRWTEPELLIAERFGGYKCSAAAYPEERTPRYR
jgi:hypothetical protein